MPLSGAEMTGLEPLLCASSMRKGLKQVHNDRMENRVSCVSKRELPPVSKGFSRMGMKMYAGQYCQMSGCFGINQPHQQHSEMKPRRL